MAKRRKRKEREKRQNKSGDGKGAKAARPKRRVPPAYKLLLPIFGLLLLVAVELLLRLVGVGSGYRLFERYTREDGKRMYRLNPRAAERFFFRRFEGRPVAPSRVLPVEFPVAKDADTIRIIALGGSTTAGFPWPRSAAFPGFLRVQLSDLHPDKTFEVINCGLTALNSYAVLDFMPEVLRCRPDLIVVYCAHNEFYGAHGVGSLQSITSSRVLTRLFVAIQKLRLFQMVQKAREALRKPPTGKSETTLIHAMARDREIRPDSRKSVIAHKSFQANLEGIVRRARRKDVPVVLCTVISNVRDLSPLSSIHRKGMTQGEIGEWERAWIQAVAAEKEEDPEKAIGLFRKALELDAEYAEAYFRLARCEAEAGRWEDARKDFEKALVHDVLRFRADPSFNRIIREIAAGAGSGDTAAPVILADTEADAARRAEGGVIGYDLMTDHLHPNELGNHLIARSICEALSSSTIAGRFGPAWDSSRLRGVDDYAPEVGLSAVERFNTARILVNLYDGFPFTTQIDYPETMARLQSDVLKAYAALSPEEIAALELQPTSRHTFEIHMKIAEDHLAAGEYAEAAEAFREATRQPGQGALERYQRAWTGIAECERNLGRQPEALAAYNEALKYPGNAAPIHYNLGRIHLAMNDPARAEKAFENVLAIEADNSDALINLGLIQRGRNEVEKARGFFEKAAATETGRVVGGYHLAMLDLMAGEIDVAVERLEQVLETDPTHVQSVRLLGFAHLQRKQYALAAEYLEKAGELDPADAGTWYNATLAYSALAKFDRALECLREAVRLDRKQFLGMAQADPALSELRKQPGFRQALLGDRPPIPAP